MIIKNQVQILHQPIQTQKTIQEMGRVKENYCTLIKIFPNLFCFRKFQEFFLKFVPWPPTPSMGQNQGAQYLNYLNHWKLTNLWANLIEKYHYSSLNYIPRSQLTDTIPCIGISFKLKSQNFIYFIRKIPKIYTAFQKH